MFLRCFLMVSPKGLSTRLGNKLKITEGPVLLRPFSYVKQSWDFFSLFRNSDRLASTFSWSEDPSPAWLVPSTAAEGPAC